MLLFCDYKYKTKYKMKLTTICYNCKFEYIKTLKRRCPKCNHKKSAFRAGTCKIVKAKNRKPMKHKIFFTETEKLLYDDT